MVSADLYLKVVGELSRLGESFNLIHDCDYILHRRIRLPITIPFIDSATYEKITSYDYLSELNKVFKSVVRSMGVKKVIIPRVIVCEMKTDERDAESVVLKTWKDVFALHGEYTAFAWLRIASGYFEIGIPIAIYVEHRASVNNTYRDSLIDALNTMLFLYKNPWFVDALHKAFAKVYGNANADTLISVVSAVDKLAKAIGAGVFD